MSASRLGDLMWEPPDRLLASANMTYFMRWVSDHRSLSFRDYDELRQWSVTDLRGFWESIWQFSAVKASRSYTTVIDEPRMPGTTWFQGARLNYTEHLFRHESESRPAIIYQTEGDRIGAVTWSELRQVVGALAATLKNLGVGVGDRVASILPNLPEAVMAFMATTSIGAVWSSASPDFGAASLQDRFRQIEPKVLFAPISYRHKGKTFDRKSVIAELQAALPSLRRTILAPQVDGSLTSGLAGVMPWSQAVSDGAPIDFEQVPFDHPLWIVYTSGTTGLPKPIVHGHGGILLERLKTVVLHSDVKPDDVYFWFTTTGWIMWNLTVSALLGCSTIVLYEGSPLHPSISALWNLVEQAGATVFGASSAYFASCMDQRLEPLRSHDLSRVRMIGATASPLPPEAYGWVYQSVKPNVWLMSSSGGTDIATALLGGCPLLPVRAGEIQCRPLGADVYAFDESGRPVVDRVGELVVCKPMPSMPLYFWNDPDNRRYLDSYFDTYPGVWRHGDWVCITSHGGAVIYGRSDSTINRMGIRVGTSDIYRAVENLTEVQDSLVVEVEAPSRESEIVLFVVLTDGVVLDSALRRRIELAIRERLSPRSVPDYIYAIQEVPRTLNGKKLEVPVKRILMGVPVDEAVNLGSVSNPASIEFFSQLARLRRQAT